MENAAYVSPPQLPPQAHLSAAFQAAVTNASTASTQSFQEALMSRMGNMGRPFGLTVRQFLFYFDNLLKLFFFGILYSLIQPILSRFATLNNPKFH